MRIFFLIGLILSFYACQSQSTIDSLAGDFLIKNHSIDTLLFKKTEKKGKFIIESNYYTKKELSISLVGNEKIDVFTFGSNSEHGDKFMLIDILSKSSEHSYKFLGYLGLEQDLETLVTLFKQVNWGRNIQYKKGVLKILLSVY